MRAEFRTLEPARDGAGVAVVGAGALRAAGDYHDHTVHVTGTFTGSVSIQGTIDGSTWFTLQVATAPGLYQWVGYAFRAMRINITALSSGAPVVYYGGRMGRAEA